MGNYLMMADRLYEISNSGLKKSQDNINAICKLYYRDPLLAKTKNTLVFYRKFNSPRELIFNYYDIYYDDVLWYMGMCDVANDYYREELIIDMLKRLYRPGMSNDEKQMFSIQTDITEAILITYAGEKCYYRDMVLLPVYMNKENIWDSLVVVYPFGNLYDRNTCCWGTEEDGTIHSLGEWFNTPHNNDLSIDVDGVNLYEYLNDIILRIMEEEKDFIKDGLLQYILNDISKRFSNTLKLFADSDSLDDEILQKKINKAKSSKELLPVFNLKKFIRF